MGKKRTRFETDRTSLIIHCHQIDYYVAYEPRRAKLAEIYNLDKLLDWDYLNLVRTGWWVIKPCNYMLKKDRLQPSLKAAKKVVEDYAYGKQKFRGIY